VATLPAKAIAEGGGVINQLGLSVLINVSAMVAGLMLATGLFVLYRLHHVRKLKKVKPLAKIGVPLSFHSPDDTPREFKQFPYRWSYIGQALMYLWALYFAIAYLLMAVLCWFVYPTTQSNSLGAPPAVLNAFGNPPEGLQAPWLLIYTVAHAIWFVMIQSGDAMRVQFMIPVKEFEDATHVVVEEDVEFITDDNLVDPDMEGDVPLGQAANHTLSEKYKKLAGKLKRAGQRTVVPITVEGDGTRQIEYTCVRYSFDEDTSCFQPRGISEYRATEVHRAYRAGGLTHDEAARVCAECGQNEINVHVPGVFEALFVEFMDFTKVIASMGTWAYMVYSAANMGMVWFCITFLSGAYKALCITRPNQIENAALAKLETDCEVLRQGEWKTVGAKEIVLGDIIRVDDSGEPKLPCDGILIEGAIVTNESMLTGEPMPVQKLPAEDSESCALNKRNIGYAGTKVLQSNGPENGKAVLIATAVGALTTRGQLVRMVLFPTSVRFKYIDQLPYVYMCLLGYVAILVIIYAFFIDIGSWVGTILIVINTCAMTMNPMLPVSMVIGQASASARLKSKLAINCLQPGRIPIAGKISTMVFDKTGTITKEGMDFTAVIPVTDQKFQSQVGFNSRDPESTENRNTVVNCVPTYLRHALASCHTVTKLDDGMLIGNAVEVSMVRTCGWDLGEARVTSHTGEALEIVKKLDFDHHRMTSGVVVRRLDTKELEVYIKGSYERVKSISAPESVPLDYDAVTAKCAKDGYYTLGIAMKTLPAAMDAQALKDMTRDTLETGLNICGLLLFINEMKPDSPSAFTALERGSIRSVICTGDNALTGISIGVKCGVVKTPNVLLGDVEDQQLVWRDSDSNRVEDPDSSDAQLAVTHAAWRHLHKNEDLLQHLWTRIVVFARMKPDDKINVVTYLQSKRLVVGMAGDGGNDCGGLRAAHAGMALSDAEASMVSPFSSGRDGKSLMTVVDMIREGRACLSTNLATFRFFMVYGFVLTIIRTFLLLLASLSMGEFVWLTNDILFGIVMVSLMCRSEPADALCSYRPTATLFGVRTVSAIAFPVMSAVVFMIISYTVLWQQSWYVFVNALTDLHIPGYLWMLKGDNYDSAVGVLFLFAVLSTTAFVNTYGGDFRQNIIRNRAISVAYAITLTGVFVMILAPPSQFGCIYRVNCGTEQSLASGGLLPLKWFSKMGGAGLVGGCFLGPQLLFWQEQLFDQLGGDYDEWMPELNSTDPSMDCRPPSSATVNPAFDTVQFGCVGPNNCYSTDYRWSLAMILLMWVVLNHSFVKIVLQGPIARRLRENQEQGDRRTYGLCGGDEEDSSSAASSSSEDGDDESEGRQ
jgi:cation-transporting ATPase 13A3/4/5